MMKKDNPVIYFGGDYNPDQWPEEIWHEDMRLFKLAGINMVSLPMFSWARIQSSEDTFDFEWLDKILDMLHENGISVCLATPTAAQPAWMSAKYPEILPVDVNGRKRTHGKRVNFCPNSKKYRQFAAGIASKMAERYKNHPALKIWHVANEYGTYCFCENCAAAFRVWLKERYGTVEELNKRWNLSFWGHLVYDWEEIVVPSELNDDNKWYQSTMLDYLRFMTDSNIGCFKAEYDVIKKITPDIPVMTNISGLIKQLDQFRWAEFQDLIAWDNYPSPDDHFSKVALKHDLMRGLKNGQSFMMVESTPSQQNWQPYNTLKAPGVMRLISYQALAHGSDTVMFFQMRASVAGVEKLHGAVIDHSGHENTRVFRECAQLGHELAQMGDKFTGGRLRSKVAVMFDWSNWWAVELSSGPNKDLQYFDQINKYYKALHGLNVSIDIIRPDADLTGYEVVVAPLLYMLKPGEAEAIERFVENGGTFVTTFFSGIVDENDRIPLGGYPGKLRKLLGIWVEEFDALKPEIKNAMVMTAGSQNSDSGQKKPEHGAARNSELSWRQKEYECGMICDLLHLEGARELAVYRDNFYAGMPCLTVNHFGKGKAYYVAADPQEELISELMQQICEEKNLHAPFDAPEGVEITQRFKNGKAFTFILNHTVNKVQIDIGEKPYLELVTGNTVNGTITLQGRDVAILMD